jgi:hypothetical protein
MMISTVIYNVSNPSNDWVNKYYNLEMLWMELFCLLHSPKVSDEFEWQYHLAFKNTDKYLKRVCLSCSDSWNAFHGREKKQYYALSLNNQLVNIQWCECTWVVSPCRVWPNYGISHLYLNGIIQCGMYHISRKY